MRHILPCLITLFLAGCFSIKNHSTNDLTSYFEVQKNYASVLDNHIGNNRLSRVVPVVGAHFDIGTPVTAGTTSPVTANCKIADTKEIIKTGFSPLPVSKSERTFSLSGEIPVTMQRTLKDVLDLGVKFDSNSHFEMNFGGLRQELLPEDALEKLVKQKLCADAIRGKTIIVIRGYIFGKSKISFGDNVDTSATAKFAKVGEYTVKYVDKSGFQIEDSSERPQFAVIAEIDMSSDAGQRQPPSADSVKAFSNVVPVVSADQLFR